LRETNRALRQYLERHAEPEVAIATDVTQRFGHVLTIPAAGEGASLRNLLSAIPAGPLGDVLVILVVNASTDAPKRICDGNASLLAQLNRAWGNGHRCGSFGKIYERPHGALLLIDRASPGRELPAKQGVGLARKIGADLALSLWHSDRIESPWIHCTDADVELPSDYFEQPSSAAAGAAALTYRYRHVAEDVSLDTGAPGRAALEYEISLRYYVRGLAYAGSPFAFHTIGSTLAIRADAYAQTRGFPRRLAAEDFYILNKLAKVGKIEPLAGLPIALSSRLSARVPFGTGRALIDAQQSPSRQLYHPGVFDHLAVWQSTLVAMARSPETPARDALRQMPCPEGIIPGLLEQALDSIGALERAPVRARTSEVRLKQLQHAFDAGRTLKLIHALRDLALPSVSIEEAIADACFIETPGEMEPRNPRNFSEAANLESIAIALGRPDKPD
jgi:hypothetical protein